MAVLALVTPEKSTPVGQVLPGMETKVLLRTELLKFPLMEGVVFAELMFLAQLMLGPGAWGASDPSLPARALNPKQRQPAQA